jgi:hypothetical protein
LEEFQDLVGFAGKWQTSMLGVRVLQRDASHFFMELQVFFP